MGLCLCTEPGESILKDLLVFFGLHLVGKTIVATCDKGKGPQRNFCSRTVRLSALPKKWEWSEKIQARDARKKVARKLKGDSDRG